MTSVSAGHIILTPQPVESAREKDRERRKEIEMEEEVVR